MKDLKVTGLAQETDFDKDGEVQFLLVFNKGELRVPISSDTAQTVLQFLYANSNGQSVNPEGESDAEENTVAESDEYVPNLTDEDGVDQV